MMVGWRGKLLGQLPLHRVASRELTNSMRQIRAATGGTGDTSAILINKVLKREFAGVIVALNQGQGGRYAPPHVVRAKYLSDVESGTNGRDAARDMAPWLKRSGLDPNAKEVRGSRVPPWLVWAYDAAFGADGYLIDMYGWMTVLREDYHRHELPRMTYGSLDRLTPGTEREHATTFLPDLPAHLATVLDAHVLALTAIRALPLVESDDWRPNGRDASGSLGEGDDDNPEGVVLRPGERRVVRWVLRNLGEVPWQRRVLYRIAQNGAGLRSEQIVPVPDTEPGGLADVRCVVQAPDRPGTYRMCLKMGWPDGVYSFPASMLGVILTVVVPPADVLNPWQPVWPADPEPLVDAPSQGKVLATVRSDLGLSQRTFMELLTTNGLAAGSLSRKMLGEVERGESRLPDERWRRVTSALIAAGRTATELRTADAEPTGIRSAPVNTPEFRRRQWLDLYDQVAGSRWWQDVPRLITKIGDLRWQRRYQAELRRIGVNLDDVLDLTCARLRLGGTPEGGGTPSATDAMTVESDLAERTQRVPRKGFMLFHVRVRNSGNTPWRNRLLYRVGATVASSLPVVPAILPVPDTEPGATCEIHVPCAAQYFPNLAEINYVLVFADCTPCLTDRINLYVDTRSEVHDATVPLPENFVP